MNSPDIHEISDLINQTLRLNCSIEPIELESDLSYPNISSSLMLVGRIVSDKSLNCHEVRNTIQRAWNPTHGFKIREQDNKLLFIFNNEQDMLQILEKRPWVCGLPPNKMTKNNAITIAKRIGTLLEIETSKEGKIGKKGYMRIKIEINIEAALPKGFAMKRSSMEDAWIEFRYERLPDDMVTLVV
ncbi:hypothetical protein RJ639_026296 [Escallonia herrerae]|uniref:DUF4283 domain-containing protein n=1 Tax=Escallonia herrerae TaxID=1293975 RepID=A0AA88S701_9ASTE|nr:hypothetical protein RJ639_026296 [Escallonia herrerae]